MKETRGNKNLAVADFHDYRAYLRAAIAAKKEKDSRFSMRSLARDSKLAVGFISMVLSGKRSLTKETLERIALTLRVSETDRTYLELLRLVAESSSQEVRLSALDRLKRFKGFQDKNKKELEVYEYLKHWYYVAIREMARVDGFKNDPKWIQSQLRYKVSLGEVEEALRFLVENKYIEVSETGKTKLRELRLECLDGVYKVALSQFQREMLDLAKESIEGASREERVISGHTMAIPKEDFDKVEAVIEEAMEKIAKLEKKESKSDSVYHILLSAFPLVKAKGVRGE